MVTTRWKGVKAACGAAFFIYSLPATLRHCLCTYHTHYAHATACPLTQRLPPWLGARRAALAASARRGGETHMKSFQ